VKEKRRFFYCRDVFKIKLSKTIQTMRQTVRLLTLLMAVIYGTSAFAAVDPYEAMEITPAEGVVTSLQHFYHHICRFACGG